MGGGGHRGADGHGDPSRRGRRGGRRSAGRGARGEGAGGGGLRWVVRLASPGTAESAEGSGGPGGSRAVGRAGPPVGRAGQAKRACGRGGPRRPTPPETIRPPPSAGNQDAVQGLRRCRRSGATRQAEDGQEQGEEEPQGAFAPGQQHGQGDGGRGVRQHHHQRRGRRCHRSRRAGSAERHRRGAVQVRHRHGHGAAPGDRRQGHERHVQKGLDATEAQQPPRPCPASGRSAGPTRPRHPPPGTSAPPAAAWGRRTRCARAGRGQRRRCRTRRRA